METIRKHAHDLIAKKLAPAEPHKDGKQTPYRGHPVFVAQHATGTCCRTCLQRNHEIPKGRPLTTEEREYVVDVICAGSSTSGRSRRLPRVALFDKPADLPIEVESYELEGLERDVSSDFTRL